MDKYPIDKIGIYYHSLHYYPEGNPWNKSWETTKEASWMLEMYDEMVGCDKHLIKAKADCASLVKHLMKSQYSLDALQSCYDYYNGKLTRHELDHDNSAINAFDDPAAELSIKRFAEKLYWNSYEEDFNPDNAETRADLYREAVDSAAWAAYSASNVDHYDSESSSTASSVIDHIAIAFYLRGNICKQISEEDAKKEVESKCADICREVLSKPMFESLKRRGFYE